MYSTAHNLWTFTWFVQFELPFRLKGTEKIHTERFFKFPSNIYSILYAYNTINFKVVQISLPATAQVFSQLLRNCALKSLICRDKLSSYRAGFALLLRNCAFETLICRDKLPGYRAGFALLLRNCALETLICSSFNVS